MENDSLFGDDAEPPGPSVEIVASASEAASIFLDSPAEALPVVSKAKPQRQYFPFTKDSPAQNHSAKSIIPISAAWSGSTGDGSFKMLSAMLKLWAQSFACPTMSARP